MVWKFGGDQADRKIGLFCGWHTEVNWPWTAVIPGSGTIQGGSIEWENHLVDLPVDWTSGEVSCLELAFVNVGGNGNHTWIDQVNLSGANSVSVEVAQSVVQMYPQSERRPMYLGRAASCGWSALTVFLMELVVW